MSTDLSATPLADLSIDESARPLAPSIPNVTEAQRSAGRHLAVIHRHHLIEVARAKAVYRHVVEGDKDPEAFQKALQDMDLIQNFQLFGNLCGHECQMLNFHHDAEEHHAFPQIEAKGSEAFHRVVEQLRKEHLVVHELIVRLQSAAEALVGSPDEAQFQDTAAILTQLETVIRSHFGYEETELAEALGVYVEGF